MLKKREFITNLFVESRSKKILLNFFKFQSYLGISKNQAVAGYYPVNNEVNDLLILNYLSSSGYTTLLPCVGKDKILSFKRYLYDDYNFEMSKGKFNIKEPKNNNSMLPSIILAPLLAFSSQGDRIGYGGGYYDATLNYYKSINHKVLYIGIAYSFQEVTHINTDFWDVSLDAIITEKEYKYFDRGYSKN